MPKITTEVFIERARKLHGARYDYSNSVYTKSVNKISISCEDHGEFTQEANSHLRGAGCPRCAKNMKMDTSSFSDRASQIHGGFYSYSTVDYKNNETKVEIICPKHGSFMQRPAGHLNGEGCNKCGLEKASLAMKSKKSKSFVDRAMRVHGSKYSYNNADYKKALEAVCITCPHHGDFWQRPSSHLRGDGCPSCSGNKNYSKSDFIYAAKDKHGEKYSYDLNEFRNLSSIISITCPKHGEFSQLASSHAAGKGCNKCACEKRGLRMRASKKEFIEKATAIHGEKYDYSKTEYKIVDAKIVIRCPKHGYFSQIANRHLCGAGCASCHYDSIMASETISTSDFVKKASIIHNGFYSYGKTKYFRCKKPVTITCPIHGDFEQKPTNHLSGGGCASCSGRYEAPTSIYAMSSTSKETKIGISVDPVYRHRSIQKSAPFYVSLHGFVVVKNHSTARAVESEIHRRIKSLNCGYTGFDGATEWFNIDPEEAIKLVKRVVKDMGVAA